MNAAVVYQRLVSKRYLIARKELSGLKIARYYNPSTEIFMTFG